MVSVDVSAESPKPKTSAVVTLLVIMLLVGLAGLSAYTFQVKQTLDSLNEEVKQLAQEVGVSRSQASGVELSLQRLESKLDQLSRQVKRVSQLVESKEGVGPYDAAPLQPLPLTTPTIITEIYNRSVASIVVIEAVREAAPAFTLPIEGTGFVFDPEGRIVTNNHVVEGAQKIKVTYFDGNVVLARVVGADPFSDLAILEPLSPVAHPPPLPLGDSSKLRIGEPVVAIGNPFGLSGTITAGIVSQKGRLLPTVGGFSIANVIQIDAAINPGNSGGPLLNLDGEVVGITTAIATRSGEFAGVGFAVPSNTLKRAAPSLIALGSYKHPWIGVGGLTLTLEIVEAMNLNTTVGVLITEIFPESPAEQAGLRGGIREVEIDGRPVKIGGDVVVAVDGRKTRSIADIINYIDANKRPGDEIILTVLREGQKIHAPLTLGERPSLLP